ncbi:hypothetical protein BpHYR1_022776 [Brachionus plicatilis]|uniref:Uncharacterized protein n=1 Tax=Brachionus plicatilis TaxID=10195 RepID=A0A3M7QKS4_BRAPC|nr:hypothetical protein BpHYR1_022776 [Brachionus plicatilis]
MISEKLIINEATIYTTSGIGKKLETILLFTHLVLKLCSKWIKLTCERINDDGFVHFGIPIQYSTLVLLFQYSVLLFCLGNSWATCQVQHDCVTIRNQDKRITQKIVYRYISDNGKLLISNLVKFENNFAGQIN